MSAGKITLYIATSVDGYIADEEGGVDWLEEFQAGSDGGEEVERFSEFFETVDCLVIGSTTYEQVRDLDEWPYGEKPTYVFTHRNLSPASEAVRFVDEEIETFVPELRQQHDHIWLVGGAELVQSFLREHEIDDVRVSFIPILLGDGIPLFSGEYDEQRLRLLATTSFDSGIAEHHYEVIKDHGNL